MFIVTLAGFVIAIIQKKIRGNLAFIFYYIILSLVVDFAAIYFFFLLNNTNLVGRLASLTTLIFVLCEYGLFLGFIIKNLNSPLRKFLSKALLIFFYFCFVFLQFFHLSEEEFYITNSAIDSIGLIVASLFYFFELLNRTEFVNIKNESPFWAITAILFYASCSLPIYLFQSFLSAKIPEYYKAVFSINFFLYIIVHLLFIKAYLCKKKMEYA